MSTTNERELPLRVRILYHLERTAIALEGSAGTESPAPRVLSPDMTDDECAEVSAALLDRIASAVERSAGLGRPAQVWADGTPMTGKDAADHISQTTAAVVTRDEQDDMRAEELRARAVAEGADPVPVAP